VRGISFDQERSVVGKVVQAHLRERKIKFTAFKNSKSKAKFAEGAIRLVRTLEARLERKYNAGLKVPRALCDAGGTCLAR
jgi:hypothetical protein